MNTLVNSETTTDESLDTVSLPAKGCPRTAIAGVSGYAGGELSRLLLGHPRFEAASPSFYSRARETESDKKIALVDLHPILLGNKSALNVVEPFNWHLLEDAGIELLFLATPHEQSRELVPAALARGIRVVDLSGAWRLQDAANRSIYKMTDEDPHLAAEIQAEAIYGSPELHRGEIRRRGWWRIPAAMRRRSFWRWRRCCGRGWSILTTELSAMRSLA